YFWAHSRTYGSVLSQLTHVYVQNCTATTRPLSPSGVSGSELSHPVAPSKGGRRPSLGKISVPASRCAPKKLIASHLRPRGTGSGSRQRRQRGQHLLGSCSTSQ